MKLTAIEISILNNRLIDECGYNCENMSGDYIDYCENLIVNRDLYESINEMLVALVANYGKLIIE